MLNTLAAVGMSFVLSTVPGSDVTGMTGLQAAQSAVVPDILVPGLHDYGAQTIFNDYSQSPYQVYMLSGYTYKTKRMYTPPVQDWNGLVSVFTSGAVAIDSEYHYHDLGSADTANFTYIDRTLDAGCFNNSEIDVTTIDTVAMQSLSGDVMVDMPDSFFSLEEDINEYLAGGYSSVIKTSYDINGRQWQVFYYYEMPWLNPEYQEVEAFSLKDYTPMMGVSALSFDENNNIVMVKVEDRDELVNGQEPRSADERLRDLQDSIECFISTFRRVE